MFIENNKKPTHEIEPGTFNITHSVFDKISNICLQEIALSGKEFTEKEINDFLAAHPITDVNGKQTITGEPKTFDEYILFNIYRFNLIASREIER